LTGNANASTQIGLQMMQIWPHHSSLSRRGRRVTPFKDGVGRIKRQAARFRLFRYDDHGEAREVSLQSADIENIEWTAHIANKKPIWFTFSELQGDLEFGPENSYENQHIPRNNPNVTRLSERKALIIDPGPRSVSSPQSTVAFSRYNIPEEYSNGSFPPVDAGGQQIDVLGELRMNNEGELIALGGFGKVTGSGDITSFRGAAGYWDDISDGYVVARITLTDGAVIDADPAWLVVGSPKFVPEVVNIITLADTMEDVAIRFMNANPAMFKAESDTDMDFCKGVEYTPLNGYQSDYIVNFERDIRPIIERPQAYRWVANVPTMSEFSSPRFDVRDASDGNAENRREYFSYFRVPLLPQDYADVYPTMKRGPAHMFADDGLPMMPLNSGDNSVTNNGPIYKFLTLSPTQYFYMHQWVAGKFTLDPPAPLPRDLELDHVDVSNCVGGPFSPGIEVTWIVRNAPIYSKPFQIKLAHFKDGISALDAYYAENGLSTSEDEARGDGCEPGDLTKRMAIPWMADFQECTVQTPSTADINTNQLADGSGIEVPPAYYVYWWPPQSPFNVMTGTVDGGDQVLDAFTSRIDGQPIIPAGQNVEYQRGIESPQDMVNYWSMLGFVMNKGTAAYPYLVETERNFKQLGQVQINREPSGSK
jgi:L-lysine 6-oxidase